MRPLARGIVEEGAKPVKKESLVYQPAPPRETLKGTATGTNRICAGPERVEGHKARGEGDGKEERRKGDGSNIAMDRCIKDSNVDSD